MLLNKIIMEYVYGLPKHLSCIAQSTQAIGACVETYTHLFCAFILEGAGRIGPLPNRPSANRPPKKVSPGQIGPIKIWHWTNRPPVENFCYQNLFVDLQRAFDWFDKIFLQDY